MTLDIYRAQGEMVSEEDNIILGLKVLPQINFQGQYLTHNPKTHTSEGKKHH